jgi:hypothetical protein
LRPFRLSLLLLLLGTGCLADPARTQAAGLLDQLVQTHAALSATAAAGTAGDASATCDLVGGVDTRLTGEPGLVDLRPTWPALRAATDDLLAACGQVRLLEAPALDTLVVREAHQRWAAGASRSLAAACTQLQTAAISLGKPAISCLGTGQQKTSEQKGL